MASVIDEQKSVQLKEFQKEVQYAESLRTLYKTLRQEKYRYLTIQSFKLLPEPFSIYPQRGYGCQLYSFNNVLNRLHAKKLIPKPLPLHKHDEKNANNSLRQQYKALDSVAGEPVALDKLQEWANTMAEVEATTTYCNTQEAYAEMLKQAVDSNLPAMVHYDMSLEIEEKDGKLSHAASYGLPIINQWRNLHVGMVVGYLIDNAGALYFIINNNGTYKAVVSGDLYHSASQPLNRDVPSQTYRKIVGMNSSKSAWLSLSYPIQQRFNDWPTRTAEREGKPIETLESCMNGAIFIVDTQSRRANLIRKLEEFNLKHPLNDRTAMLGNINQLVAELINNLKTQQNLPVFKIILDWKEKYDYWWVTQNENTSCCPRFFKPAKDIVKQIIEKALDSHSYGITANASKPCCFSLSR